MMAATKNSPDFPLLYEEIGKFLDANRYRVYTYSAMMRVIREKTNQQTWWIKAALGMMLQAGLIEGRLDNRQQVQNIRWKDVSQAGDDRLKTELDCVKKALRDSAEKFKEILQTRDAEVTGLKKALAESKTKSRIVEVRLVDSKGKKTTTVKNEHFHSKFEDILTLARARKNIFVYGPCGSGKSHLCAQVARALKMRFAFVSCTAGMSEGTLNGRLLPTGKGGQFEYTISEFVDCYENGGVFFLDELDAADPNAIMVINAALAGSRMPVPSRKSKPYADRHPDFVCIAAANTFGTGADRMHTGRNKLDASTLDRFQIGKVRVDYDPELEKEMCPDDELRARLILYREAINAHRLERVLSIRFLMDAHQMVHEFEWDFERVEEALFTGWRDDEIQKVKSYAAQRAHAAV